MKSEKKKLSNPKKKFLRKKSFSFVIVFLTLLQIVCSTNAFVWDVLLYQEAYFFTDLALEQIWSSAHDKYFIVLDHFSCLSEPNLYILKILLAAMKELFLLGEHVAAS